jgi:hypothetical protein
MRKRKTVAGICYAILVVINLINGSVYLFSHRFMSYHSAALGLDWTELAPDMQILLSALMRVGAGGWLALAVATALLLLFPFRYGKLWSYWTIPLITFVYYIPNLYATLLVTLNTAATAPWFGNVATLATALAGFLFVPKKEPLHE